MIGFSKGTRDVIADAGIKEIYLELRYTKGPCVDHLCKMIPHVEVSFSKHFNSFLLIHEDSDLKVYAVPPVAESIKKHNNEVIISKGKLGKSLKVSGITYSF